MRIAAVARASSALLVLVGWLALLWGLWVIPTSTDPELDLEAGPAFGITLEVYVPAVVLSLLLLALLAVGVAARRLGPVALVAAATLSGAFAFWVLDRAPLLDYRPGLGTLVWIDIALSATALATAVGIAVAATATAPKPSDVRARTDAARVPSLLPSWTQGDRSIHTRGEHHEHQHHDGHDRDDGHQADRHP